MSDQVVIIDGSLQALGLMSASFVARPGDTAIYRPAVPKLDGAMEKLLAEALADPFTAPAIRELVHGPAAGPREDTLAKLVTAIRSGWLLAIPLPGARGAFTRIPLDRAPEELQPIRRAAPQQEEACREVLARGGKAAAESPLLPHAARVLAAWSMDRSVGPGPAVRAVHAVEDGLRRSRIPFAVAAHLVAAAEILGRQDKLMLDAAFAELKLAAEPIGWPQLLAVLVAMTREFRPMGGIGRIEPPPPATARQATPPPSRPPPPQSDDAAQAEALRQAAQSGVPFCIPCAMAAAQAGAA